MIEPSGDVEMLSEHIVAEAAREAGIVAPVRFASVTGSTNTDALRLADAGAPEWTITAANAMTQGRGRAGRSWWTKPGASLPVSVLLRPALPPAEGPLLALAGGLAMAKACRDSARVDVRCKWPNDLLAGDRKLGGVLSEAVLRERELAAVVVGVGVNLSQERRDFPQELRDTATSIALEGGRVDAREILAAFLAHLRQLYGDRGAGLAGRVLNPYRALCATIGRRVRATTTSGTLVEGAAVAVDDSGALVIQTPEGERTVAFGEIQHLR